MLTCKICGYTHEMMISSSHLKKHGITGAEYKAKFPGSVLRVQSEESKNKIAVAKRGKSSWNAGLKTGSNVKISESKKGVPNLKLRGQKRTEEQRKRISDSTRLAMEYLSTEKKDKMAYHQSCSLQLKKQTGAYVPPMLGKKLSVESRNRIGDGIRGKKNGNHKKLEKKLHSICETENIEYLTRSKTRKTGNRLTFLCLTCNQEFSFGLGYFTGSQQDAGHAKVNNICPFCFPREKTKSSKEIELLDFVRSVYTGRVFSGNRTVLFPKELDIYLPDKNIGIEFCGIYWHSENVSAKFGVSKYRDYEKYLKCRDLGVRLITIFEDEWDNQKEIVKDRLQQILGTRSSSDRIHARKCSIVEISATEKNSFLREFHIQRSDMSTTYLGAFYENMLVAVMTFSPTNFVKGGDGSQTELNRFAVRAGFTIPGIASRLLTHYIRKHPSETVISYSDNRWSEGNVYKKLGFTQSASSKPGYFYIDMKTSNKQRFHRSSFMKHKLIDKFPDADIEKMIEDGMSEWEIMQEMGYDRIWDCGTTRWVLKPSAEL